jgi:TRAP-type C4-dicarboxylate transport system substrate-binding protein
MLADDGVLCRALRGAATLQAEGIMLKFGLTIFSLLAPLLLIAAPAGAQQVTLKATLQAAMTHPFYGVSMARFKEEIEKRSGGAVALQIFDKSQLAHDDEVVDAVSSGVADIGTTATHNYAGHSPVEFIFTINDKVWQSLTPAHRAIMTEAASLVEREARERVARIEAEATRFAIEKGFKLQDLTPDQVAEWRACSAEMLSDYMEQNGELAQRLMAAYAKLRTEPCCTGDGPASAIAFTRR